MAELAKFKVIKTEWAFIQTVKALENGVASLLLEKSTMGDRLFVVNNRGESIGIIDWSRVDGWESARELQAFMEEHGSDDGLFHGMSQTYAIGSAPTADGYIKDHVFDGENDSLAQGTQ